VFRLGAFTDPAPPIHVSKATTHGIAVDI